MEARAREQLGREPFGGATAGGAKPRMLRTSAWLWLQGENLSFPPASITLARSQQCRFAAAEKPALASTAAS
jgi:hypothetical protein